MSSLKKLAIRGAIWTFAGYGFNQVLRFVSNLILTRLLVPELFGLMALVNTFIAGLQLFSDLGIGPSIIQNKRGDSPSFLNTAWTIQVIRGLGVWLCCLAITWPVSTFYNEPRLFWLLPIVSFTSVLAGFNSTKLFTLDRNIALGKLTLFDMSIQIISIVVMVIWAYFSPSIWALVVGTILSSVVKMIGSHYITSGKANRFEWDQSALQDLVSFGRWIFVSTAMTFLATQSDRLLLGKYFTLELLGIYSIAFSLADMPRQVTKRVYGRVLFPVVAKLADTPREELRLKIVRQRRWVLIAFAGLLLIMVGFGDFLIHFLYEKEYAQAGWMLPILSLGLWPNLLANTISPCLFAIGQPRYVALGNFFSFLTIALGIPIFFNLLQPFGLGTLGAVAAVAISEIPVYACVNYGLVKEKLTCLRQDAIATFFLAGVLALAIALRMSLGMGLPIQDLLTIGAS
jgi:O-antigen/teichoic acid export membrane protein